MSSSVAQPGEQEPAATAVARPDDWFEDLTGRTGIDFAHRNGREAGRFFFIESFGGGVAMVDYDRDGDIDLFFTGGGTISAESPVRISGLPSALFRNDGDWRFADASVPAGFGEAPDYSQGCAVTDFDADGFPDLLVCCYGRSRLYRNRGDGTYAGDADDAGLPSREWHTAAAFGDIDRDGLPDLFLARYTDWSPERDVVCKMHRTRDLCGPSSYAGTTCQFFHNCGDGRFEDWSARVGLQGNVHGLGVVAADFNGDGRVDFYVASDETPKHLYLGTPENDFREAGAAAGVAVGELGQNEGSMGVDVGDYNGDGRPDIFVTNFENEDCSLYRNLGDGLFLHSTVAAGLSGRSRRRVGFGTALTDFNGDGWLDLFVLNGNPIYTTADTPFKQAPQLFLNRQGRRFENISDQGGPYFREEHSGRGAAAGDLDDDGAPDLVTVLMNEPVRILANRLRPRNFIGVELRARGGEPDATGARLTAEFDGRRLVRFVARGTSYFSQPDPRFLFPLSPETERADVIVEWPGRAAEVFRGLKARGKHVLVEGRGENSHEPR
ncbi:MAG: CRTAC1 family protein [Deltaproteobacteria bacterium]